MAYKLHLVLALIMSLQLVVPLTQKLMVHGGQSPTDNLAASTILAPLPVRCSSGLTSGEKSPLSCMFGYIFIDGQAVAGAKVTITSKSGSIEVWTEYGSDSPEPYYYARLSDPPLNVQPGDTITVDAAYSSHSRTLTHTVIQNGQQVDVVLPRAHPNDLVFDRFISQPSNMGTVLHPHDITVDLIGNIYVIDTGNARIQVFGQGHQFLYGWGTRGDAYGEFSNPTAVAVSRKGDVYISDTGNHRIQQFTSNGTFVRSWGVQGDLKGQFHTPQWVAVDSNSNVYVTDMYNHRVQKFSSTGSFITSWGSNGSNNEQFNTPEGIAVDRDDNIYVADSYNYRIQKFDSNGTWLDSWGESGTGDGQFDRPHDVETDRQGNVYVSDSWNHRIQKFSSTGKHLITWGAEGSTNGQFIEPHGISIDSNGNVNVADYGNSRIQMFTNNGAWLSNWAVGQVADDQFLFTASVALDHEQNLYIVDTFAERVQKFNSSDKWLATWGEGGHGNLQFVAPRGIAVDRSDNIYIADTGNHRIQKLSGDGVWLTSWGGRGSAPGQFVNPIGVAVDKNDTVYVVDTSNHRIQQFTNDGTFIRQWGELGTGNGQFESPHAIAIDDAGSIYITDKGNHRVQKFTSTGKYLTQWGEEGTSGGQFKIPEGISVDSSNNVYVADTFNHRIQKFTSSGDWLGTWGIEGGGRGQFDNPNAILVDNSGMVFVSEADTQRIQILRPMTYDLPIPTIVAISPYSTMRGQPIELVGMGSDSDETPEIARYEWTLDGSPTPFSTTAKAILSTATLTDGLHTLTLRVHDTEGAISLPQTVSVRISSESTSENQTWAFLLYMAGDNSGIAPFLNRDSPLGALYRLEHSPPNQHVSVVALYDGQGSSDSFRYILRPDGQFTQESLGEVNTGNPQTLVDFVRWGQQSAPADHYYLAIAGPGNGLDGVAWDFNTDRTERLTNAEMRQALVEVTENGGRPIDVLHLDGCRMGMLEYAYQVRGMASFLIATEDLGWSAFSYEKYRAAVGSQTSPQEFANMVVHQYASVVSGYPHTIAALDMAQIDSVVRATHSMAHELLTYALASTDNRVRLTELRGQVQKFDSNADLKVTNDDEYVDLGHWAELVAGAIDNPAIRRSATELRVALQQFVISERHASGSYQDTIIEFAQAQGVAIYFPDRANAKTYTDYRQGDLGFPVDTFWDEFLTAVLPIRPFEPITTPPAAPIATAPVPTPGLVAPTPTQSAAPNTVQPSQSVMSRFPYFGNLAEVMIEWIISAARLLQRFDRADWIR